jgi:hypothetical protein
MSGVKDVAVGDETGDKVGITERAESRIVFLIAKANDPI